MSRLQLSSDFCDPDRVSALGDFLLSSYGPRASAKAFVGSGGHLSLTATSQRILRSLELSDACCEAVLAAVRAHLEEHRDGGLLSGILVCQLTRLLRPLSPPLAGASAGTLRQIFRSCLLRNRCHLDWGQARHVLALARSVLSSKPWLRPREVESLSLSLARGFLNTIPERAMDDGHYRQLLKTKVIHGRGDEHRLVSGFIYRCPNLDDKAVRLRSAGRTRVLVLNLQLKSDLDELDELRGVRTEYDDDSSDSRERLARDLVKRIVGLCMQEDVGVVANQKVVAEELVMVFKEEGILCLDRLGSRNVEELCIETGATLIASTNQFNPSCLGLISSLSTETLGGKSYLTIQGKVPSSQATMNTIVVEHWNEEICEELQVLCESAVSTIFQALDSPYVVPGAGCFEACLILEILKCHSQLDPNSPGESSFLRDLARSLCRLTLAPCGLTPCEASIDLRRGHLWVPPPASGSGESTPCCCCRCKTLSSACWNDLALMPLEELAAPNLPTAPTRSGTRDEEGGMKLETEGALVDLWRMKEAQLLSSLEVALGLAAVGTIIQI